MTGNGESAGRAGGSWWTVPNVLSALRVLAVPLFLYLILGPHEDVWALVILAASGVTDWLDGKLARWLGQYSRLGALLDPAADRLYIVATLVAFVVRGVLPWWVAALLVLRELLVGACLPLLRRRGYRPPEVHYVGKAATFVLMYAFPLLLLAQGGSSAARTAHPIATAFVVWGCALYLWSGALYLAQTWVAMRRARAGPARDRPPTSGDGGEPDGRAPDGSDRGAGDPDRSDPGGAGSDDESHPDDPARARG